MIGSVLLALHMICAVVWVGGMAFALLVLRPSLSILEPPQRLALHAQTLHGFFRVVWHVMPLILVTGYAMVLFVYGGFGAVGPAVNIMQLIGLIMAAVFVYIYFVPWKSMRAALDAKDRDAAVAAMDRIRKLIIANLVLGTIVVLVAPFGP